MYWASGESRNVATWLFKRRRRRPQEPHLRSPPESVATSYRLPRLLPLYTDHGRWKHGKEAWTNWCEGFLGGQMWLFYELDRRPVEGPRRALQQARRGTSVRRSGPRPRLRAVPDLEEVVGAQRRHQPPGRHSGGRTMATRFNNKGRSCARSWAPDSNFIDIMMNVGIIALAGLETNDQHLLDVAEQHCETTRKYLVRGDGSTSHEGIFDLETGEFLRQTTQQGWRNDSSWARG